MRNKTIKKIYVFVTILIALSMLSCEEKYGFNPSPKEKEILVWSTYQIPSFFYPSMTLTDIEKQVVNQMFEGITRVENDDVIYGMADDIDLSADKMVYHITLRKAQWSDGKFIDTNEFIYSWERDANYREGVNLLYYDTFIDSVEVINEREMEISMRHPNEELLKQLSMVEFMPMRPDVVDLTLAVPVFLSDVTNGPFTFASSNIDGDITLSKNKYYYDFYQVNIDEINLKFRDDDLRVYKDFLEGHIDVVQDIGYSKLENLLQNDAEFTILDKPGVYSFSINSENPKLRDVKLRQLLNLSIDRAALNPYHNLIEDSVAYSIFDEKTIEELRTVSGSDFEYMGDLYTLYPKQDYVDVDKVNQLLKDLDDSVLKELKGIKIITTRSKNDILIAKLLSDSWQEHLGVSIQVEPKDRYDFAYALNSKSYDIILNSHYYVDFSPRHMLKYFLSDTVLNKTTFDYQKFDNIMMKTLSYDDSSLHKLYETAIKDVDDTAIMIPLFNTQEPVLIDDTLMGWTRSYESLFNFSRSYKVFPEEEEEE